MEHEDELSGTSIKAVAARIKERLAEIDMSARAASKAAGRGADAIRNIYRAAADGDDTYSPRSDTLQRIARILRVRSEWLTKGEGEKLLQWEPTASRGYVIGPRIPYSGVVEAGAFREVDLNGQEDDRKIESVSPDPRFSTSAQFGWEVRGDSMDEVGMVEGSYVIGVNYYDFRREFGILRDGLFVVVERLRNDGSERELTVKQYRLISGQAFLAPCSKNPAHKAIELPSNYDPDEDTTITVRAVVVAIHRVLQI